MYSSTIFHSRLSSLCKEHGTTISQFAKDVLQLSTSAPTYWKRGAIPGSDILYQAAEYFHVSTDYLLGLDDEPSRRQQDAPTQAEMEMLSEFRTATPTVRALAWASAHAVLGTAMAQQEPIGFALSQEEPIGHALSIPAGNLPVQGYAAAGSPLFDRETDGKTVFVQEKYTAKDMNGDRFFVVEARGDSMEPIIPDGTPVVVQRGLKPLSGDVALVSLENASDEPEYVIKLVHYLPDEIELSSYNEAYKPFRRPLSEVISAEKIVHILEDV